PQGEVVLVRTLSPHPEERARARLTRPKRASRRMGHGKDHQKKLAASMPLSLSAGGSACHWRGFSPLTASATARMCAGVVPQQPPTTFSQPASAQPLTSLAVISGGSS